MNISTPANYAKNLPAPPTTPLKMAHALLEELKDASGTRSDFTSHLTNLAAASHILSSDLRQSPPIPAELRPQIMKTARYITDIVKETPGTPATRLALMGSIHTAAAAMLAALATEIERYEDNMSQLLTAMKAKMKGEMIEKGGFLYTAQRLGKSGIDAAMDLEAFVGEREGRGEWNEKYLSEIAGFWRRWAERGEAGRFEEVWTYVAGRAFVQD